MSVAAAASGFCGRCGAPFGPESGAFCARCGNPIVAPPPASTGYSYPVVAAAAVPGAQHRLTHSRLLIVAGAALVAVVVVITVIVVAVRPTPQPCHFFCGPRSGPRLINGTLFTSSQFGYRVPYDSSAFTKAGEDAAGIQLQAANGDGEVTFTAASGSDTNGAIQAAVGNLSTSEFQNMQQVGPVPGAEIGFVQGDGAAFSASFTPSGGTGQGVPVGIVVMASTQNNVTIVALVFSQQDLSSVQDAPFGLTQGSLFDSPISNMLWPGQQ
jgi:hypothetical protein